MAHNTEWLNENSLRDYPFAEGSTLQERFLVGGEKKILPSNFIIDLRLSGTESFIGNNNVDYFLYKLERVGSTEYVLTVREIQREIYHELNSSTYKDVGTFTIPFGSLRHSVFNFNKTLSTSKIQGKLILDTPLDLTWTSGVHEFLPQATTLEARACVPFPERTFVSSLGVFGDATLFTGDVKLAESSQATLTPREGINGIKIDFSPIFACPDPEDNPCIEDENVICDQPALMKLNGAEGDHRFNVHIQGMNGINVSALTALISGGNPFNPSHYYVRGLVITYGGMVTSTFNGGDPDDYANYTYGLNCLDLMKEKLGKLQSLVTLIEAIVGQNTGRIN